MASQAVQAAVRARIGETWNGLPVVYPNEKASTPNDGGNFLSVQYPVSNSQHVGMAQIGARTFREEGGIRLVLSANRDTGVDDAMTLIEELKTLFRAVQFSGVMCLTPSGPAFDDNNGDGNYYLLSLAVPYYFDELG
ncbi:MAG TPA: phage tail terminator-like protein [Xanthobacteraceae bacterium]|nr:phage tail terminator-like protein [Xanthobacteraceae bacterium]